MKKFLATVVAVVVAMLASVGIAPAAQAYPEKVCNLVVSSQVVKGGQVVTATCSIKVKDSDARTSAAEDTDWVMTFNGETRTGSGSSFTAKFTAPHVTKKTKFTLTSVGTNADGNCKRSVRVTVLAAGDSVSGPGDDSGLPGTGGPRLALLLAGLGLVLAGGVAIRRSRNGAEGLD